MRKVSLILAFCMVAAGPVFAQGATKPKAAVTAKPAATAATPEVAAAAADAATTDDKTKAIVEGFRSAKFGMNEADIRAAISKDFGAKPDAIKTPVNGGLLMFRGSDAKDRTVMLLLQGTFETKENNQRILTPTGLLLFYVADAKSPDVFKLPPGQF